MAGFLMIRLKFSMSDHTLKQLKLLFHFQSSQGEMSARKTLTQKLKKIHLPFKNRSSAGTENGKEVIGNYEEQDGMMENPSATVSHFCTLRQHVHSVFCDFSRL